MTTVSSRSRFNFSHRLSTGHTLAFPILIALLTGILVSIAAIFYIKLIELFEKIYFGPVSSALHFAGPLSVILIPTLGGLLAGLWLCKIFPQAKGSSVPEVLKAIIANKGRIHPLVIPGKIVATALSLGSGTAVGREGPIVQVGAAIGSNIAKLFRLSELRTRNLIACGAAASIATVFNAPITGVMYSLEIILRDFGAKALSTVVIAAVISSILCRTFLGENPAFFSPSYGLHNPIELLYYFILGIICGLISILFNFSLHKTTQLFSRAQLPQWLKPAIGGFLIGCLVYFYADLSGTGFNIIQKVLQGDFGWKFLLLLTFLKIIASSISLGSNNPGGLFGPTLFIGSMLGGSVGHLLKQYSHFSVAPPGAYALAAMASVFAGSAHAPMTAMFLVFELTDNYHMILPVMTCVVVSTSLSQWLHPDSMDDIELKEEGINIESLEEGRTLSALQIGDVMSRNFEIISPEINLKQVLYHLRKSKNVVVQKGSQCLGIITEEQLNQELLDENMPAVNASDLVPAFFIYCHPEEPISEAGQIMLAHGLSQLPVVESSNINRVVGIIKANDLFAAYTKLAAQRSDLDSRTEAAPFSENTEVLRFSVSPSATNVIGKELREVPLPEGVLLTALQRKNQSFIIRGNTVFQSRDKIWAVVEKKKAEHFKQWLKTRNLKITS